MVELGKKSNGISIEFKFINSKDERKNPISTIISRMALIFSHNYLNNQRMLESCSAKDWRILQAGISQLKDHLKMETLDLKQFLKLMGVSKPTAFKEILIGYQFSAYISYRKVI